MENKDGATTEENNKGTTHWEDCFTDGPKHWVCAMRKIGELEGALRAACILLNNMQSESYDDGETEH
jgi:hypothetical protein